MEDKEKQQYESTIANQRAEIDRLVGILDDTIVREQEGNKATVQAIENVVTSYNVRDRYIVISIIIAVAVLLAIIYLF